MDTYAAIEQYRNASEAAPPSWSLRWRCSLTAESDIIRSARPEYFRDGHFFGIPLVRDPSISEPFLEIEAQTPGGHWVRILAGTTRRIDDRTFTTTYPLSPLQDTPAYAGFRTWPYINGPDGQRIYTDVREAPVGALIIDDVMPRIPEHHTEALLLGPERPPVSWAANPSPVGEWVKLRRYRKERWAMGSTIGYLWRRVE